jgi:hypothetical protein
VAAVKAGEKLHFYLDGRLVSSTDAPKEVFSSSWQVAIGANPCFPGDEYFNGQIDDFALHAKALSADEIMAYAKR